MTSVCSWPAPLACLVIRKPLRFWPKARSEAKTRQGRSFAKQKFFAPCLKSLVLSERGGAKERRRRTSRHGGSAQWIQEAGRPACYECEFEPRAIGLNERIRLTACMTRNWPHRLLPQLSAIRGLARLRSELAAAFWSGNTTNDIPCFFIDMHMSTGTRVTMRPRSGGYIDRTGPAESEAISRIAELSRQAGDAVRGLTEAHGARQNPRQNPDDSL